MERNGAENSNCVFSFGDGYSDYLGDFSSICPYMYLCVTELMKKLAPTEIETNHILNRHLSGERQPLKRIILQCTELCGQNRLLNHVAHSNQARMN